MKLIAFGKESDLATTRHHIRVTFANLAPLEIGVAQEEMRRKEEELAGHLERCRVAKDAIAALDPEIAKAQAEVKRTTELMAAAETELQKSPSAKSKNDSSKRDAFNSACQVRADAAELLESLNQRQLAGQAEIESFSRQQLSIEDSLSTLRAELAATERFYQEKL
jgi:chromosome segregation ATPase